MFNSPISQYLIYANLQMAAEAVDLARVLTGDTTLEAALIAGNSRSSKFTPTQAAQFVQEWKVVDHQSNKSTGFSGTLFEYIGTNTDPNLGPVTGQRVVSLRSTEFVDDAVRDTQATNNLEISNGGWAIGQIADMKTWFDSLNADPAKLQGKNFSVTGYSLGGHLATALNLLYPSLSNRISATYTFSGAGVGRVNSNTSLLSVVDQFNTLRSNANSAFTDPAAIAVYFDLKARYIGGAVATTPEAISAIAGDMNAILTNEGIANASERNLLYQALGRIKTIMEEAGRIANFGSGLANQPPLQPVTSNVEAVNLDYQIAVLLSQRNTSNIAVASTLIRKPGDFPIANMFDVFGDTSLSAIANSQLHYGQATPIFIEDQPLYRGTALWDFATQSLAYWGIKLLQNGFSVNDFGDTHSLVLLVDSLSIQNALATLDPNVQLSTLSSVLQAASAATKSEQPGGQGKSEGDVLERTLDALRRMLLDPAASTTHGSLEGGSWANEAARATFHQQLKDLIESPKFSSIKGKVTVGLSNAAGLKSLAQSDFAAFLALQALSPLTLSPVAGQSAAVESALSGGAMAATYAAWAGDRNLSPAQRASGMATFSDRYYSDRADMLGAVIARNLGNTQGLLSAAQFGSPVREQTVYVDAMSQVQLIVGGTAMPADPSVKRQVWFGGDLSESKSGSDRDDRLFGGGNNDTLSGVGGADWLEGNTGNDSLLGGEGADTLLGGAGDDTLAGGSHNDSLLGGSGFDRYVIEAGGGFDIIRDADGQGSIQLGSIGVLSGANEVGAGTGLYWNTDRTVSYRLTGDASSAAGASLFISSADGQVRVEGFHTGDLGLTLGQPATPPVPPVQSNGADYVDFIATALDGLAGNDALIARFGAQSLLGGLGNDLLIGGAGDDRLDGGDGNDFVNGGQGHDIIYGGAGNDLILGANYEGIGLTYPSHMEEQWQSVADSWSWAFDSGVPGDRLRYIDEGGSTHVGALWRVSASDPLFGVRQPLGSVELDTSLSDIVAGDGDDFLASGGGERIRIDPSSKSISAMARFDFSALARLLTGGYGGNDELVGVVSADDLCRHRRSGRACNDGAFCLLVARAT